MYNDYNSNDKVEDQVIDEDFEHMGSSTFVITVVILVLTITEKNVSEFFTS